MGANGRDFLEMRTGEQSIQLDESKKNTIKRGSENAKAIIEAEEQDIFKIFGQSQRMEEFLKSFNKEMRAGLLDELKEGKFDAFGMEFSSKNGASRLNYKEDSKWEELKKALSDREELLKVAEKSSEAFYDSEGVEVPKVTRSHSGQSLNVKY